MLSLLDRLLISLEVRLEAFALLEVARDHRLVFEPPNSVIMHYVLSGGGWLETAEGPPVRFESNSVIILPPRVGQALRSSESDAIDINAIDHCAMSRDGLIRFNADDNAPIAFTVLCGSMMPSISGSFGLFDGLKAPLVETFLNTPITDSAFTILRQEVENPGLGTRGLAGAVMKVLLVLLIRRHLHCIATVSPLFAGVDDERLGRAIAAVLDAPADPHTLVSLSDTAGMSRSAFARAFTRAFDQSPMEFVARTRLHHAAELLRGTDLPIKVIAASIGFASRSHFSRAFRKAYGSDPRAFRKPAPSIVEPPRRLRGSREEFSLSPEGAATGAKAAAP